MNELIGHFNYASALFFFLFGIFVMIAARNLIRKIIGMGIMQTGVIIFFISLSFKHGAKLPIVPHHDHGGHLDITHFANPLPHALMLTAIVVGVSLLGVALILTIMIYKEHQSLEEDKILASLEKSS